MAQAKSNFHDDGSDAGREISTTVETITPCQAKSYLLTQENNRPINDKRVSDYVGRMERGEWMVGQPITFDSMGCLIDGQHRLKALIKYGNPVDFLIMRGLPSESRTVFDIGQQRTAYQIARITGNNRPQIRARLSILSCAFMGSRLKAKNKTAEDNRNAINVIGAVTGIRSPHALLYLEEKYSDGLDLAVRTFGGQEAVHIAGRRSVIQSVFFRAYYTQNHKRILEFIEAFYTGISRRPEDDAAIRLRDFSVALRTGERKVAYGKAGSLELYTKTESALLSFLQERPIKYLKGLETEEFPLADFD
jgi:hypothetical protein